MVVLELFILNYILSYFVFRSDNVIKKKKDDNKKINFSSVLKHLLCLIITLVPLTLIYNPLSSVFGAIALLLVLHILIDIGKYNLEIKYSWSSFKLFILEQLLHILSIIITWYIFNFTSDLSFIKQNINISKKMSILTYYNIIFDRHFVSEIILFIDVLFIVCFVGDKIVGESLNQLRKIKSSLNNKGNIAEINTQIEARAEAAATQAIIEKAPHKEFESKAKNGKIFHIFYITTPIMNMQNIKEGSNTEDNVSNKSVGRYIGLVERFIVFLLIINKQFTAMTFLITAKSIVRYKRLDKEDFAEEYLLGTLLSILIAVAGGCIFLLIGK